MADDKLDWAMPVMRAGYAGRSMTYVVISGLSLWTIWQGGQAQGTSEALKSIEGSAFGVALLAVIGLGLLCYTAWRIVDAAADLEEEGSDGKGMIARAGMAITGVIHGALGIAALLLAFGPSQSDGGPSKIEQATQAVMEMPFGVWLVGFAGLATIGTGIYYLHKAWTQSYRQKLVANKFTRNWNMVLRSGVAAQGVVVTIIGGFLFYAALTVDPQQAGGLGQTFSWVSEQTYGQIFVTLLCLGLLGFALFLFVNALYRVVPRLKDPKLTTLADT